MSTRKKAPKKKATTRKKPEGQEGGSLVDQSLLKGLSHPLRVRMLALLCDRPWSPRRLSDELGEGLGQVSYHIKVLKDHKLIELVRTEPRRGAVEHFYRATHPLIIPEGLWAQLPKSARQKIFADVLEDIDKDVSESIEKGTFDSRNDFHVSLTPMQLDEKGCRELAARTDQLLEDALAIQAESSARQAEKSSKSIPISTAILVFESARGATDQKATARKRG